MKANDKKVFITIYTDGTYDVAPNVNYNAFAVLNSTNAISNSLMEVLSSITIDSGNINKQEVIPSAEKLH